VLQSHTAFVVKDLVNVLDKGDFLDKEDFVWELSDRLPDRRMNFPFALEEPAPSTNNCLGRLSGGQTFGGDEDAPDPMFISLRK